MLSPARRQQHVAVEVRAVLNTAPLYVRNESSPYRYFNSIFTDAVIAEGGGGCKHNKIPQLPIFFLFLSQQRIEFLRGLGIVSVIAKVGFNFRDRRAMGPASIS